MEVLLGSRAWGCGWQTKVGSPPLSQPSPLTPRWAGKEQKQRGVALGLTWSCKQTNKRTDLDGHSGLVNAGHPCVSLWCDVRKTKSAAYVCRGNGMNGPESRAVLMQMSAVIAFLSSCCRWPLLAYRSGFSGSLSSSRTCLGFVTTWL